MSARTYVISAALACCLVVPIIVGVSCPPPSNPPFLSLNTGTSTTSLRILPCEPNRVCIDVVNQACVDAEVVLYMHNGYDLVGDFVVRYAIECCENENAPAPCPCYRPGSDVGELQLTPPELFGRITHRTPFVEGGDIVTTLQAEVGRIRRSFPCDQIKSFGIDVGGVGDLPARPDERSSVRYRCSEVAVNRDTTFEEHVACGATLQFRIYDRNDCALPELTVFRISPEASQDCKGVTVTNVTDEE